MGQKLILCIVAVAFIASISGCASIFYPSRINQPAKGTLDVGMLVLDIILTGFLGVIVDLITGALFFPAGYCMPVIDDILEN